MDKLQSECPGGTAEDFSDKVTNAQATLINEGVPAHRRRERWWKWLSLNDGDAIEVERKEDVLRTGEAEDAGRSDPEEPRATQQEGGTREE
ncbi:hypothetical protein NDU88_001271 [Pleurodeles waltl]|uniref:Uncharacterized protein n=1 Tax=Pleurodeles waltl TaxID=8319 RepID=A0AAV7TI69_PLEWA|nr:hypothetical protein NDU88_001271 [Pleurodeles waltl]